jgi:hypothetical protein
MPDSEAQKYTNPTDLNQDADPGSEQCLSFIKNLKKFENNVQYFMIFFIISKDFLPVPF